LYALNTLGGAVGIGAMGFGLPAAVGVQASYGVATATSALAGMLALAVGESGTAAPPVAREPGRPARLHAAAAGAGAVGLALEVLWTRLFAQVLHNSVYSFAAVSLVFLVALASGAALGAVTLRRVSGASVATASLIAAALATSGGAGTGGASRPRRRGVARRRPARSSARTDHAPRRGRDAARGGGRRRRHRHGRRHGRGPPAPAGQLLRARRQRGGAQRAPAGPRAAAAPSEPAPCRVHRHGDRDHRERRTGPRCRRDGGRRARPGGRGRGARALRSVERHAPRSARRPPRRGGRSSLAGRDRRPLRRRRLRPLHPLACRRREPLRARDVRRGRRAPRPGGALLPVAAPLPADARGVRHHRADVPRRLPAGEPVARRLLPRPPGRRPG